MIEVELRAVTLQAVVIRHERMGVSADEIASHLGVSLADVYAALAYYYDEAACGGRIPLRNRVRSSANAGP